MGKQICGKYYKIEKKLFILSMLFGADISSASAVSIRYKID
jgi:hypothetical protein